MNSATRVAPDESSFTESESRIVPVDYIERRIYRVREQNVMLDSDLADLYQVTTGNLNLAVKRNLGRFPVDFMYQMTKEEGSSLLLQSARAKGATRPANSAVCLYGTWCRNVIVSAPSRRE